MTFCAVLKLHHLHPHRLGITASTKMIYTCTIVFLKQSPACTLMQFLLTRYITYGTTVPGTLLDRGISNYIWNWISTYKGKVSHCGRGKSKRIYQSPELNVVSQCPKK